MEVDEMENVVTEVRSFMPNVYHVVMIVSAQKSVERDEKSEAMEEDEPRHSEECNIVLISSEPETHDPKRVKLDNDGSKSEMEELESTTESRQRCLLKMRRILMLCLGPDQSEVGDYPEVDEQHTEMKQIEVNPEGASSKEQQKDQEKDVKEDREKSSELRDEPQVDSGAAEAQESLQRQLRDRLIELQQLMKKIETGQKGQQSGTHQEVCTPRFSECSYSVLAANDIVQQPFR